MTDSPLDAGQNLALTLIICLLGHCLRRCAQTVSEVGGVYGVALHALTTRAADLYDSYGFREYGRRTRYPFMILPAQSLLDLVQLQA